MGNNRLLHLHQLAVGEACEEVVLELLNQRPKAHVLDLHWQFLASSDALQDLWAGTTKSP